MALNKIRNKARVGLWLLLAGVVAPGVAHAQQLYTGSASLVAEEVDRMYVKGMQSLVRTQTAQGNWPDEPRGDEPALNGLAVISLLAHGDDPNFGPYSTTIHRGLNFILKSMDPKTGYIGSSMYNHGFATLALAESYGAVDDPQLGPALQKAVRLIVNAQKVNGLHAWRYSPESQDADTTVSGAQMVALFAARNAGMAVPEDSVQNGIKFFLSCQTPAPPLPALFWPWPGKKTRPPLRTRLPFSRILNRIVLIPSIFFITPRRHISTARQSCGKAGIERTSKRCGLPKTRTELGTGNWGPPSPPRARFCLWR
jgi:hypothetical protein